MQDVLDITVKPLSPAGGAEISGLDLTRELSPAQVRILQQAWNDNLVLVFRDQDLSQEDQLRFAGYFGPLGERKVAQAREDIRHLAEGVEQTDGRVLLVSNKKVNGQPVGAFGDGEMWFHIDSGYAERPYMYSFLYAQELPSTGGNTRFANMYRAYEQLPAELKAKLADKKALHIHEYKRSAKVEIPTDLSKSMHWFHPVFTKHPRSDRMTLFVDRLMTQRIEGISAEESVAILEQLYEIGEREENIYEHVWRYGDFVMWDNRATIHARTWFPPEETRLLRRCTVEGEPIAA